MENQETQKTVKQKPKNKKRKVLLGIFGGLVGLGGVGVGIYFALKGCSHPQAKKFKVEVWQPDETSGSLKNYELIVNGHKENFTADDGDELDIILRKKSSSTSNATPMLYVLTIRYQDADKNYKYADVQLEWNESLGYYTAKFTMPESDIAINAVERHDPEFFFYTKNCPGYEGVEVVIDDKSLSTSTFALYKFTDLWQQSSPQPVQTYSRSEFNLPVIVGNQLHTIPNSFLSGCENFNSSITFSSKDGKPNKVSYIGKNFLIDCTKFNQEIVFPDSVTSIGGAFLHNCTAYNNGEKTLNLNKIEYLADEFNSDNAPFLYKCINFNQNLEMPNLKEIPYYFMGDCINFNKPLTIPASVTKIGDGFMFNCYGMYDSMIYTNVLTINSTNSEGWLNSDRTCAVGDKTKLSLPDSKFKITGPGAKAWHMKFTPKDAEGVYRELQIVG